MNDTSLTPTTPTGHRRSSAVLITGAGGEVGHGLIDALHAQGREEIVAIDIRELEPAMRDKCRETFVGDICDPLLLGRLLAPRSTTSPPCSRPAPSTRRSRPTRSTSAAR